MCFSSTSRICFSALLNMLLQHSTYWLDCRPHLPLLSRKTAFYHLRSEHRVNKHYKNIRTNGFTHVKISLSTHFYALLRTSTHFYTLLHTSTQFYAILRNSTHFYCYALRYIHFHSLSFNFIHFDPQFLIDVLKRTFLSILCQLSLLIFLTLLTSPRPPPELVETDLSFLGWDPRLFTAVNTMVSPIYIPISRN